MTPKAVSFRLPEVTTEQVAKLCEALGATQTQIIIMAIDRMAREELKRKEDHED